MANIEDGSIEFQITMDPNSEDIRVDGKNVGYLQWQKGPFDLEAKNFRVIMKPSNSFIPLPLDTLVDEAKRVEQNIAFISLRQEARELLYRAGIPSNPGYTEGDIIDAITVTAGLRLYVPYDERQVEPDQSPFESFRNALIETVLEAGGKIKEPTSRISHIVEGLKTILPKK